eukprot:CAMPEP_0117774300 /NCGR_PEP_ID=MMETSP0947-20121206/26424_1 /TAXON_ID=44440 /ORGANISM="Chattonella subsalsa, Strain CCMP2191" /LENGTH=171 /DNA_ID=CAMNT_0005600717 /DNA_START=18 /DNA_END=531 /DNA_ORIENTATION=+
MKVKHIGMELEEDENNKWVMVKNVSKSAPPQIRHTLKAGDRIVSVQDIDGRDVESVALLREALVLGGSLGQVLKLRFLRGEGKAETESEESSEEEQDTDAEQNEFFKGKPRPGTADSQASKTGDSDPAPPFHGPGPHLPDQDPPEGSGGRGPAAGFGVCAVEVPVGGAMAV